MIRPRLTPTELYSSFLKIQQDQFAGWVTHSVLARHMQKVLEAVVYNCPNCPKNEDFWTLYWHKQWQHNPQGLAYSHLVAYLQEPCYWAVHQTVAHWSHLSLPETDYFQMMLETSAKVIQGFDPTKNTNLRNYARISFSNQLRKLLTHHREVDVCSDWALLYKSSLKRIREALVAQGAAVEQIAARVQLCTDFKDRCPPVYDQPRFKIKRPTASCLQTLLTVYQSHPQHQTLPLTTSDQVETELLGCARSIRHYLYPTTVAYPEPILDSRSEPDSQGIQALIQAEEIQAWDTQKVALHQALLTSLAQSLTPAERDLLELYYGQNLTQTEIGQRLNIKQYTVSRKITKARTKILKDLALWSQANLHISLSKEVLVTISTLLEEWLVSQWPPVTL